MESSAWSVRGSLCETNPKGKGWTVRVDGIHKITTADGKGKENQSEEQSGDTRAHRPQINTFTKLLMLSGFRNTQNVLKSGCV